jgi:hypothetical protein
MAGCNILGSYGDPFASTAYAIRAILLAEAKTATLTCHRARIR